MSEENGIQNDNYRKLAIIVGTLFIIYTGGDILSLLFLKSVTATDYLVSVSANAMLVGTGALILLIGGICGAGIAIALYPMLKKFNASLALGAVGFRVSEGILRFVAVWCYLLLITLSQQFVQAGTPDSSYFQTLGALIYAGNRWANVLSLLVFSTGALQYYIIFYRTKLVPRWISGWGLIAAILSMVSIALVTVGLIAPTSTTYIILNLPMLPQEMVLAAWLIAKGFNPSVSASKLAQVK